MALEFGWNGNNGYVSNNSRYQLLTIKPTFSFNYKSATYSSDSAVTDIFIATDGSEFTPTVEQLAELDNYIVAHSLDDPYAKRDIAEYTESQLTLSGVGMTEVVTHTVTSTIWNNVTGELKRLVEAVFIYDVFTTGSVVRDVPFSVVGLEAPVSASLMSINGWTISGGNAMKTHTYRLDLTKRTTDDMLLKLNGSNPSDMNCRVEIRMLLQTDIPS